MRELPPEQDEAIRLRYDEGLTASQAGRRMGRTAAAIRLLCGRGLERLRAVVGRA